MNKILRYSFMALLAMVFGNVMAEDVIWSEDFSSYAANDVPSGGDYNYVCTDGASATKIYEEALAQGTSPELLVSKKSSTKEGGTFSATINLGDKSGDMTLSFKCNKNLLVTVEGGTIGENTGSGNDYVYAITGASGSLVITFTNGLTSNARLDNIKLAQGESKKPAGLSWGTSTRTVTIGADDNTFPTLSNENNLAVTYESSNQTVATIAADGTITLLAAGETTISASSEANDEFEAGHAEYKLIVKAAIDPDAKGQVNNPYTIDDADFLALVSSLNTEARPKSEKIYVKGFITNIDEVSVEYGNATFKIAATKDKDAEVKLVVYRAKYLNGESFTSEDQIAFGDEVVIHGQIQWYNSEPQFTQGCYIYSLEREEPEPELPVVEAQPVYKFTANGQWASYTFNKADFKAATIVGFRIEYSDMTEVAEGAAFNILVNSAETHLGKDWAGNDAQVPNKTAYMNYGFDAAHTEFTGSFSEFVATDDPATTCPTIGQFALQACAAGNSVIIKKVVFIKKDGTEILPEYKGDDWGGGAYTIEEVTDGINNVNAAKAENAVRYNLAGQKVNNDYKGVVIMNGKKTLNK